MFYKKINYSCKDAGWSVIDLCSEEGAPGKDSPSKDMLGDGSLSSFRNFISFNKSLGLPIDGFEKEVVSLLRILEARKGCSVGASSIKRTLLFMCHFDRELWKLERSFNYNQSSGR